MGTFPCSAYDPKSARIDQSALELKPCPRCGGKGLIYYEGYKSFYAECEDCPLELHDIYFSAEEAAEAWNYRADEENTPLTIEELREMGGEPVWLKVDGANGYYVMFCGFDYDCKAAHFWNDFPRYLKNYGENWLAYRRKPNEGVPR